MDHAPRQEIMVDGAMAFSEKIGETHTLKKKKTTDDHHVPC